MKINTRFYWFRALFLFSSRLYQYKFFLFGTAESADTYSQFTNINVGHFWFD